MDLSVFSTYEVPKWGKKKIVLYSGMLSKVTGVDLLIKVFKQSKLKNYELWITGKGELEDEVRQASQENNNIKFEGFVSNSEFYEILSKADIVINPRNMNFTQNMNNFPSKILEYLASGRVVVSTRFPGYQRFKNNIFFCDSDVDSIASTLCRTFELSEKTVSEIFEKNREFVKKFDWTNQAENILNFVGEDGWK